MKNLRINLEKKISELSPENAELEKFHLIEKLKQAKIRISILNHRSMNSLMVRNH